MIWRQLWFAYLKLNIWDHRMLWDQRKPQEQRTCGAPIPPLLHATTWNLVEPQGSENSAFQFSTVLPTVNLFILWSLPLTSPPSTHTHTLVMVLLLCMLFTWTFVSPPTLPAGLPCCSLGAHHLCSLSPLYTFLLLLSPSLPSFTS